MKTLKNKNGGFAMEEKQDDMKKITVQFSSTNEMSAKKAVKLLLDTYSSELDEEYQEAQ